MDRARRAGTTALVIAFVLISVGMPAGTPRALAAPVGWPPSTLVVSEVQTGGASASDEFVEIANQGSGPVDLVGLEMVYATSTGSTVTRKASWAGSFVLDAGRRVLIVNTAGAYASLGDVAYSGGFAATGGAVALRVIGGSVVDAVGWGDATNAFVEGGAALAPAAGSSLERSPGGTLGNGVDTNDNALDFFVNALPNPQGSAAAPVPEPGPSPTPVPTPTPMPTATPTSTPTPSPTPTATPAATPTPTPSPTPSPTPLTVAAARALPDGTSVTISGTLTTSLGALEIGRTAYLQDSTAGIAIFLDAAVVTAIPAGTELVVTGTLDSRYAQRTLRADEGDLVVVRQPGLPAAISIATGDATEAFEGRRVSVEGAIVGGSDALADGLAVSVDDGSGPIRIIVTPDALGGRALADGSAITVAGALGQRDSTGTGASGYRLYVTRAIDLAIQAPTPAPTPTPSPAPTATPTATPVATATPTPVPSSTPSPTPSPTASPTTDLTTVTIAAARTKSIGSTVTIRGVVTAEAGRLGTPALLAVADGSGGIVVKLPDGVSAPRRTTVVEIRGRLADPYGQLELRPAADGVTLVGGVETLPVAIDLGAGGPDEATEGRLVRAMGTVVDKPTKSTSGDISLSIETPSGSRVRVLADASSGITAASISKGASYRLIGIAGQRASRKGALDGYRVWLRDPADIELLSAPSPSPSTSPSPRSTPKPSSGPSPRPSATAADTRTILIASALRITDRDVAIEAVVSAPAVLLDATGRRIVVQDATGAIEVLISKDVPAPGVGTRIRAVGRVGVAYGAPRLRAVTVERLGAGALPAPLRVRGPLTRAHTWRLVTVSGRIDTVRKLGDRWRAEVVVGAARLIVVGQPGARISVENVIEGRSIEVVGIVRPAYPSASDRRPTILPRSRGDLTVGGGTTAGGTTGEGTTSNGTGPDGRSSGTSGSTGAGAGTAAQAADTVPDADLADLTSVLGTSVRVGGLVLDLRPDGFVLDDGTAHAPIVLRDDAADWIPLIEPGDAINLTGRVERLEDDTLGVVVSDPASIVLGSDPAALGTARAAPASPAPEASDAPRSRSAGLGNDLGMLPGAGAGLFSLFGISVASVAVTLLRRRQARRLLASRVAARLSAIAGADPADRPESRPGEA